MPALTPPLKDFAGLALPATLLALGLGVVAIQTLPMPAWPGAGAVAAPQTVILPPGAVTYRTEGHFFLQGRPIDAPVVTAVIAEPLTIMKYQVTAADYAACVTDGACDPAEPAALGTGNVPATGVSFVDATAYAAWLSARTGQVWALPTDQQWAYAAGSRFIDDALGVAGEADNPALRWLANYRKEAGRLREAEPVPMPLGTFGENENGIADMGGNVWEWTQTCHRRVHVDAAGKVLSEQPACTIRVLEGKHRASVTNFIRDARSGGCSVGVPPDNLGFRLVRQPQWHERLLAPFGR